VEHYLFFSRTPPEKTFAVLNSRPTIAGETEPFLTLARPLEMTRALWEDTRVPPEISAESLSGAPDNPAFDVGTWAAFRFIFRVTSPTTS
jgi:hypothetical protein